MRAFNRWGILLAMTLAAAVAAEEHPSATPQPLKLSTAQGPAYPLGKAGEIWATLIREGSGGRLAVAHFPGATLSSRDPAREFGALRDRTFELAVGSTFAWSAQVTQLNVLSLPWLVPGARELEALIDGELGKRLSVILEAAGVVPVAWAANGFIELASKMPVHTPADLAGMQVRAQPLPLIEETLVALKARPSAMSAADARAALESGWLDGQETSVAAYSASRLYAGPLVHLQLGTRMRTRVDIRGKPIGLGLVERTRPPARARSGEGCLETSAGDGTAAGRRWRAGALKRTGGQRDSPYRRGPGRVSRSRARRLRSMDADHRQRAGRSGGSRDRCTVSPLAHLSRKRNARVAPRSPRALVCGWA
jgi:hypothetical protein